MSESQSSNIDRVDNAILQSAMDILDFDATDEDSLHQYAVERLAMLPHIHAAGTIQRDERSGELSILAWEGPTDARDALTQAGAATVREIGASDQAMVINAGELNYPRAEVFAGFPAGSVGGMAQSLGVFSEQALSENDLAQLALVSRLVMLAGTNIRLAKRDRGDAPHPVVNLIGLIAHQLRTPLTGLRGNVQLALMASQRGKYENIPNRLGAAIESVDNMSALVQSLLDVSRLERGIYQLNPTHADLPATVRSAVSNVVDELDLDRQQIIVQDHAPLAVAHDPTAFHRVVANIVHKANAYRSDDTPIELSVVESASDVRISITYHGERFSLEDQRTLSEPLHAEHGPRPDDQWDGLPLDLAFARGVIVHHGGTILVNQPPDGDQQVITIQLPRD